MVKQMIEEEMARTRPPEKCETCNCDGNCHSQEHIQDNRADLYRQFRVVESEHKGVFYFKCKDCGVTAFSREALYRITDEEKGTSRLAWVAEKVKCTSCGKTWRRVEKEAKQDEGGYWR